MSDLEYVLNACLIFSGLFAVASPASAIPAPSGEAPPTVRNEMVISTEWLAKHLQDPDLVILCIANGKDFYANGHIPGARLINLSDIALTRDEIPNELPDLESLRKVFEKAGVTRKSRIILYGERYGLLAARAYFTLDYVGLADHAALLDGGLEKWKAERRPLSKTISEVKPTHLDVEPKPAVVVDLADMRKFSESAIKARNGVAMLDARPLEEFSGRRLSEDVPKAGHIPGAVALYWMENLVSRENPVLRPVAELRRIYARAGVAAGTRVVTYCRTGMQSSFDYFIAKYLGYDASMYDASFFEWSREDLPVEK